MCVRHASDDTLTSASFNNQTHTFEEFFWTLAATIVTSRRLDVVGRVGAICQVYIVRLFFSVFVAWL